MKLRVYIATCLLASIQVAAAALSPALTDLVERGDRHRAAHIEPPPSWSEQVLVTPHPDPLLERAEHRATSRDRGEIWRLKAYGALVAGDADALLHAATYLADSLASNEYLFESQYLLAQGEFLAGQMNGAASRMDWLSRHGEQPWRGLALYGQAQVALTMDTSEAVRLLKLCGRMSSHEAVAPALLQLGQIYQARGDAEQAIRYLSIYREAYPQGMLPIVEASSASTSARADQVAGMYYTIQVGVFSDRTNALSQKDRFEALGFKVQLQKKDVAGNRYTAVWVGRFTSREKAQERRRELESRFDDTYRVIVLE
jgi:tetratricopeptide (TPR) repeat protein